jgi:flavin reductase (DIM6/NTAB) family NADH-FMN oxidoreductase RutF
MECRVDDVYKTEHFKSFILKIANIYAVETILDEGGHIDYHKLKPVLFEMPNYGYIKTAILSRVNILAGKTKKTLAMSPAILS